MSIDPENDFRQGDSKNNLWYKIVRRLIVLGIGNTSTPELPFPPHPGDMNAVLQRKALKQLDP